MSIGVQNLYAETQPDLEFAIYEKPRPDKAAAARTAALVALAQDPSRPTI